MYLEGTNVAPRHANDGKKLIGKRIHYLHERDIDRSGRGYIFPKYGTVSDQYKKNLEINGELVPFSSLVEVVVVRDATEEELDIYR